MLRTYFYKKMLDLYLCYRGAQYSAADAYDNDNTELEKEYNDSAREIMLQIRTIKAVAIDLIGKKAAVDLKWEARTDAQTLYENKVYWMPTDTAEIIEYMKRYADNANVTEILSKAIAE